ncbi:hypothetical protein [Amycolatopsis alkalitolerans]|nr:hypothetical protein [Amycolatopsis alkalitolerans]
MALLPDTSGPLTLSRYEAANLPATQTPPSQEPGNRPHLPQ